MLGRMVGGKASPPPWWIGAGVKPAGGGVDMGGWKAISFHRGAAEAVWYRLDWRGRR